MSVKYILNQAGNKMGLDPLVGADRAVLIRFLNEAAKEVYIESDMPGSLMEQVFKVNGDQTITLPHDVGPVRGVRSLNTTQAWHINRMRPRYFQFNWTDMWKNIRLKNIQALKATVLNESFGVLTVKEVENPPIVVSVTGPTANASQISEQVVMDATTKKTTHMFLDYIAVKKDRVNNFDIKLSDIDGRELTVIPNNQLEAKYQILDVSTCPWLPSDTSTFDNYMEILYKRVLPYLSLDDDEFPAFNYDDILVNKMMQLWAEEQEKIDVAEAYDSKATRTAARVNEDQNRATEDVVSLVEHPHDSLLRRIGNGFRRRYAYFRSSRY